MSERIKYMGYKADREQRRAELKTRISGLLGSLRDNLDPFKSPEALRTDVIAQQALELDAARTELVEVLAELDRIAEVLGR
ncbi:hypothetical protein [Desulfohalovibrio reitneri]|uniref:hypothetical protein n=1 Tax=Desulfohalovibrio reitneri TaxID=1307759 RepID=UPI0004A6DD4F|nr:hypothetical protein [Desulfohalovibrio reitneri]